MSKVKAILSSIERNKAKIIKILLVCAVVQFFTSTLYRIYSIKDSRTQFETTVNLYSLFVLLLVIFQEFLPCLMPSCLQDNLKILTHYSGKGIILILISVLFMSHTLDNQQNYSAYFLLVVGILYLLADWNWKKDSDKENEIHVVNRKRNDNFENKFDNVDHEKNDRCITVETSKPSANPYDIPDDF
jgi:hypothetical protein